MCDVNCFIVDVEHSHVRFLGNLVLNLWDCGGYEYIFSALTDIFNIADLNISHINHILLFGVIS